jgi:quinol monooxygenase YgiN
MIMRMWSGSVPRDRASDFLEHLEATGIADYRAQPACLGAELWSQDLGERIRFTLVSRWTSREAIIAYAGEDWERAVLYAGDEALGLEPDRRVAHFERLPRGFSQ